MQAFLIEQMRTDPMENNIANALRWVPIGIALSEADALALVEAGGVAECSTWPRVEPGSRNRRMRELPILIAGVIGGLDASDA